MQSGSVIGEIIASSGLGTKSYQNLLSLLEDSMDVRKCHPGDKIRVKRMGERLVEFEYIGKDGIYKVDSLYSFKRQGEKIVISLIKGFINGGCLWNAVISNGGSPNLVYRFADEIFAWDIDFNTETQVGDEFVIVVYKKYAGERFLSYGDILYAYYRMGKKEWQAFYYTPGKKKPDYYDPNGRSLQRIFLKAPLSYRRISSKFSKSRFHPILRIRRPHYGVDYAAPTGTPVRTIGDGKVIFKGWNGGYGNQVIVQHGSQFKTYYGHLSRFAEAIKKGCYVKQGDVIGYVGSTGLSTGPHLDFRIKKNEKWVDPLKLNPPSKKKPLSKGEKENFEEYKRRVFSLQRDLEASKNLSIMMGIRNALIRSEVK
jgi:murein DD-endopeptidase MepM/ murein hydrolase activator NlpD